VYLSSSTRLEVRLYVTSLILPSRYSFFFTAKKLVERLANDTILSVEAHKRSPGFPPWKGGSREAPPTCETTAADVTFS
jgi:hypothetical protein